MKALDAYSQMSCQAVPVTLIPAVREHARHGSLATTAPAVLFRVFANLTGEMVSGVLTKSFFLNK